MATLMVPERWSFGGMDWSNYAIAARMIDGADDGPPRRGDNVPYSSLPGRRHMNKLDDQRSLGIGLWVFGLNETGTLDEPTEAEQARANLDKLQVILGRRYDQFLVRYMPDGSVRTALAECVSWQAYNPKDIGGDAALLGGVATLVLSDPFFYTAEVTDAARIVNANTLPFTLTNPGTEGARKVTFDFTGPIVNPRITNTTINPDVYVECLVTVAATKHLVIDCELFTALNDSASVVGSIRRSGAYEWMRFDPGDNALSLTSTGWTGATRLTTSYHPPFR
jgi:hypothetical protein